MPASIAHMLISRKVREELKGEPSTQKFITEVLEANARYMELGSLGPDLPYYENVAKGLIDLVFSRSDKPIGVDQWSYQLHSKDPNVFPLKMAEIIWKETAIEKEEWEEEDYKKFAFLCGYLTHMAADQTIHPLVNRIAGPYYKRGDAREKHRECEIYQDVWLFGFLKNGFATNDFINERFNTWCDINIDFGKNAPVWLRYLIQKSFIEAHAVTPAENSIEDWIDGILTMLRGIDNFGPYLKACRDFQNTDHEKYNEYIKLQKLADVFENKDYKDFFQDAVRLTSIYVKAAFKIFSADELDDTIRKRFKEVIRNADLSSPLEKDILAQSKKALEDWK